MRSKTAVLLIETPPGTTSAVCVEVQYRDKTKHRLVGALQAREMLIAMAREWAKSAGFTHTRRFGEQVTTKL